MDTATIVILIGAFVKLTRGQPLEDIGIAFGIDKNIRFYSITTIFPTIGNSKFH